MMTHLWVYEGELDASGTVLTLHTEGPNVSAPEKTATFKDIIEFKGDDHRVLTSHMLGEDGKWQKLLVTSYRRKQ